MTSKRLPDGRWKHTFRQSSINTADQCLERFRRDTLGLMPPSETDAASLGTAMHAAIELCLQHIINGDPAPDQELLTDAYQVAFTHQMGLPGFRFVKYNEERCRTLGARLVRHWYQEVLPSLDPLKIEWEFDELLHEDDDRQIWMSGTIDCLDRHDPLIDWKSSGSGTKGGSQRADGSIVQPKGPYKEWEYRRWAIQPTVYTWAANQHGYPSDTFTYVVMYEHGVQRFTVERGPEHWAWMREKVLGLAHLVEAELPRFPVCDSHALCSQRWCPAWSDCKGAFVSDF